MREVTLPFLSRRQTLKELMQIIFIAFRMTRHQKKDIQGTTTKHSNQQHTLDAGQAYGKRGLTSRSPPR
jgi:argonaute-like protein implicated in RNA metabolism and viral defense